MRVTWRVHQSDQSFYSLERGLLREIESMIGEQLRVIEYRETESHRKCREINKAAREKET